MKKILSVFAVLTLVSLFGVASLASAEAPPSIPDPFADDTPPSLLEDEDNGNEAPPSLLEDDPDSTPDPVDPETGIGSGSGSGSGGGTILLNKKKTTPIVDQDNDGDVDETDEEIYYAQNPQELTETGPGLVYLGIIGAALVGRRLSKKK